jgi:hypothetical protein
MLEIGGMSFLSLKIPLGVEQVTQDSHLNHRKPLALCPRCNKCKCKMSLLRIGMICKHRTISCAEGFGMRILHKHNIFGCHGIIPALFGLFLSLTT